MSKHIFARLAKYNEDTGEFEAIAADETVDRTGEVFDYARSKPNFQKWAGEFAKVTDGQSVGNVRSMHGKNAAGKLTGIDFNDDAKQIVVKGLVVDDRDRMKMAKGVYTGVSIGGSYVDTWPDPVQKGVVRYEANPTEISLVDNPCNPNARFTLVKADGMTAELELVGDPEAVADRDAVNELAKVLDAGSMKPGAILELIKGAQAKADEEARAAKRGELVKALTDDAEKLTIGVVEKLAGEHLTAEDVAGLPGEGLERIGALIGALRKCACLVEKVAEREDVSPKEGEDKYGDVKFADEKNKKYPIDTPAHIRAAWNYINKPKNAGKYDAEDVASIKAKIVSAWKAKIDKDGPPSAAEKAVTLREHALAKGMYTVAWLANVIEELYSLQDAVEAEQKFEQDDDSELPARLMALCAEAGEILCEMAEEETQEEVDAAEKAAWVDTMRGLAKVGARHSGKDKERLQKIHDHSVDMGAECPASMKCAAMADEDDGAKKAVVTGALMKALGVNDEAAAQAELTKLQTYANNWLNLPAPPKGVLRVVSKADDGLTLEKSDDEKAREDEIKRAAESGDPLALMKVVHRYGARPGDVPIRK